MSLLAVLDGAGWRLVFEQHADRIRHRIEVESDGQWRTLVESVEGEASQWWPPSPPLQSLHVESRSSGKVALLVGMSGRSHWSAGIEMVNDGAEAIFDIACRATETPQWLGSRYLAAEPQPVDGPQNSLRFGQRTVCFLALEPELLRVTRDGQSGLAISPVPGTLRWPQTVRWRYAASLHDAPGKPGG